MKRNRLMIALLASVMFVLLSWTAFAEGTDGEQPGNTETNDPKATRTVLLYMCGSDLETDGGMATHNLKQILGSNFSSDEDINDEDINFIVMTGGAWRWQLDNDVDPENDNDYLAFPEGVNVPKNAVLIPDPENPSKVKEAQNMKGSISGVYNQVWEARGTDATIDRQPDPNAGKLVCLDGDGLTGAEGTAITADKELMSDPKTLKAFINYGVANYPAEKYDLILWDHAGGPAGGFAMDQHFDRQAEGADLREGFMSFSEIIDALADNNVTKKSKKFDFIDFDTCLMNSVELNLVMADFTDYYIASAETEPGFGQDYRGWLNMVGETPDKNAFELGKKMVDDFNAFYEEGEGQGQDGTLAVVDLQALMNSDFIDSLSEMTRLMKKEASGLAFYDEFSSALDSIRYGQSLNYFDLGNFASTISVVNMELAEDDLDKEKLETDNIYAQYNITSKINSILTDQKIVYSKGTGGIIKKETLFRNADGEPEIGNLHTSGMYIFFTTPDIIDKRDILLEYYAELSSVMSRMSEDDDRRIFLKSYIDMIADYALITSTGQAVHWLINDEDKDKRVPRESIDYDKVRYYWTEGKEDKPNYPSDWNWIVKHLFEMRTGGESAKAKTWLDKIAKQQAEEALSLENISAKKEKTKEGTGYKVNIKGTKSRSIRSIQREIGIDYPAAEAAIKEAQESGSINQDTANMIRSSMEYNAGVVEGHISDDDIAMDTASPEEIIRWYNRNESDWDIDTPDNCCYALKDSDGKLYAVALYEEAPDAYYVEAQILMDDNQKVPMYLKFQKSDDSAQLTELILNTENGFRPMKVSNLTSTYTVQPVMVVTVREIWGKPKYVLPTSNSTFKLNKDSNITFEYTDIENLSGDIYDTDGDGEVYYSRFTVNDIYGNYFNITDIINNTEETVISMDLARVRHKVYTGEKQSPELVYMGETLKEGEDYTWDFYNEPNQDLTEAGNYRLRFKGMGKFTGYAVRQFSIVHDEDVAQRMVEQAEEELKLANEALAAIVDSDDQKNLKEAYERLVNAQNALADAEKVLNDTKDLLAREQQEALKNKISDMENQIKDLNAELAKAKVVDISHYAVTMKASAVYSGKVIKPKVKVSGLSASVYKVTYSNNKKVGTAKVVIAANNAKYKGTITKYFKIKPKKAVVSKVKVGKKKMTVTAKTKVGTTGGKTYQIRYRIKGKTKWKTLKTTKQKVKIKKLKKGKKYQVQIRAYAKVGSKTYYGAWSKVKTTKKIK